MADSAAEQGGRLLVVKATHALDDPERANLACNVAAVGLASGLDVHLFLAIEGVRLALPLLDATALDVPHAPPVSELLDAIYAAGTVTVCTPCASRRGLAEADFRSGTAMGGSANFVELATRPQATALVY
ncbi:hypothetical protein BH23ACT9_BH23ACT9_02040 [soil metagenome]